MKLFLITFASLVLVSSVGCGGSVTETPSTADAAVADTNTVLDTDTLDIGTLDTGTGDTRRDLGPDAGADLIVDAEGLTAYEGKLIRFVITSRVDLSPIAAGSGRIVGGKVSVALAGAMPRDHFGVGLDAFIDNDEDTVCEDPPDVVWQTIATNRIGEDVIHFTFDPAKATKIACSGIGK